MTKRHTIFCLCRLQQRFEAPLKSLNHEPTRADIELLITNKMLQKCLTKPVSSLDFSPYIS